MARSLPVPTLYREAQGSGGPGNTTGEALMVSSTASQMFVLFTVKYSSNLFSNSWQIRLPQSPENTGVCH